MTLTHQDSAIQTKGHTATPWEFLEAGRTEEDGNAGRPLTVCGGNNEDLANVYSRDDATVSISREEAIANAAFIVLAVNAHDGLVAALEGLLKRYTGLVESGDAGNWDCETEPEVIAARAALATAKATQGQQG